MPSIANVTVKKYDGVTDVTYGAVEGRSGDNPARYRAPQLGAIPATKPELRIISKPVGNTGKVKVVLTFAYPAHHVDSSTGVTTVDGKAMARVEFTGDEGLPQAVNDEAVAQLFNLLGQGHIRDQFYALSAAV